MYSSKRVNAEASPFFTCAERLASAGPVEGDELGQLVGALNDAGECLPNKVPMGCVARHLSDQQQRCVTQFHALARLHGQRGDLLSGYPGTSRGCGRQSARLFS